MSATYLALLRIEGAFAVLDDVNQIEGALDVAPHGWPEG